MSYKVRANDQLGYMFDFGPACETLDDAKLKLTNTKERFPGNNAIIQGRSRIIWTDLKIYEMDDETKKVDMTNVLYSDHEANSE